MPFVHLQHKITGEWFFHWYGVCKDCRHGSQCAKRVTQPPAGEFGKPFCLDNECVAHVHGESIIPPEGYLTWVPSETLDNSKSFPKIAVPRRVHDRPGPVFEHVWHVDLNEQMESFDRGDVKANATHVMIPNYTPILAGYSRSFHQYDQHEAGIATLFAADNHVSMATPFAKAGMNASYAFSLPFSFLCLITACHRIRIKGTRLDVRWHQGHLARRLHQAKERRTFERAMEAH